MVYLAWLGDSQAVLVRDGQPVHIMNPHTPERQVIYANSTVFS